MSAASAAAAASPVSGLYAFLGTAAAIGTAVAAKQLLRRDRIGTKAKYTAPTAEQVGVYPNDSKRDAKSDAKAGGDLETLHYAVGAASARPIKFAKTGIASEPAITVIDALAKAVKRFPDAVAMKQERGGDGKWEEWTWTRYHAEVMQCARAFVALGLQPHKSVNVLGFNSPEWFISELAAIAAGGMIAGIYPTSSAQASGYISEHSEAQIVVVENDAQLKKYVELRDSLPLLKAIVLVNGDVPAALNAAGKVPVLTWAQLMARGAAADDGEKLQKEVDARIAAQKPEQCAVLIYTSGTTGNPKAVMISHDNATWTAKLICTTRDTWQASEHILSYLPLSHIAANIIDIHIPIAVTGHKGVPTTTWFARPDALKSSLPISLRAARPTMFLGVPRVWEKIEEKMKEVGSTTTGLKKKLVDWAKSLGAQGFADMQADGKEDRYPRLHWLAKSLVFDKVRATLGLDRCDLFYSGAAPIAQTTLNFFGALNIPIWEVYGMSECSGPQAIGVRSLFKVGAVGAALPGTEMRLDHVEGRDKAGEGEICYRGRHIMMGYLKNPAQTREAIDADGYLHSGDVGRVDAHGLLYITGRIKELLIGAGGENIAPVPVEDTIKAQCPALSNVMMVGDRRKFSTALFTLKVTADENGQPTNVLSGAAAKVDPDATTVEQALKSAKWKAYLDGGLAKANKLATSNSATVQKYTVLPVDFSVGGGELTATLKVRRAVVAQKYHTEIEAMYA